MLKVKSCLLFFASNFLNSIKSSYRCLNNVINQIDRKRTDASSTNLTPKCEMVFVLTQGISYL